MFGLNLSLRPLLCVTGIAATAIGIFYSVKKRGDGERTAGSEDSVQSMEPVLVRPTNLRKDQVTECVVDQATFCFPLACCSAPEDSLPEAVEKHQELGACNAELEDRVKELEGLLREARKECEEKTKKHQNAVECISQLEREKSNLTQQVTSLLASVYELSNELAQTNMECDALKQECEERQEAHDDLLLESDDMMKALTHKEDLLLVSLADAEEKHHNALESIILLQGEKSALIHQVQILDTSLQKTGKLLFDTQAECDKLRKKHQNAVECISQLAREKSNLTQQMKSLRASVYELSNELIQTNMECDMLRNVCAQEHLTYSSFLQV